MTLLDVDLRADTGVGVLDQGVRPTCVAFAVSAAHEALRTRSGHARDHLAPEAIWSQAVGAGNASQFGMPLDAAAGCLTGTGQPSLVDWPYNPSLLHGTEVPPATTGTPPWNQANLERAVPALDGVEAELETWLAQGRVVAVVVALPHEFYRPVDGYVAEPVAGFGVTGLHAVACVGAVTDSSRGRLLIIKNSWGTAWGKDGYGYVPFSYLRSSFVVPETL